MTRSLFWISLTILSSHFINKTIEKSMYTIWWEITDALIFQPKRTSPETSSIPREQSASLETSWSGYLWSRSNPGYVEQGHYAKAYGFPYPQGSRGWVGIGLGQACQACFSPHTILKCVSVASWGWWSSRGRWSWYRWWKWSWWSHYLWMCSKPLRLPKR